VCGIAGLAGGNWTETQLAAMVASLDHRGPDGHGTYADPRRRCGLGHNRLSIIDLSAAGTQPMADAGGRRWLSFNGEIYNFVELRAELAGYPFHSATDSEVILAAYDRWGPACVERFIGMFAFAIWDEDTGEMFCVRDRLGIKPFHYTWLDGSFAFASEVKALIAGGLQPRADRAVWAAYLQQGIYDHSENTFFEGVKALPPGHTLTWRDGSISIARYWDAGDSSGALDLSDEQAADALEALLRDAIRLRLRSDVPLGVNLSGGLDSSVLFAFVDASDDVGEALNCFTAGFDDPQYDEAQFAAEVPRRKTWTQHVERLDAAKAWSLVDPLMRAEEAPFGGIGTLSYYNLHRRIRDEGVTVVLEGQGIDEMFAGYAYYQHPDRAGTYQDGSSFLRPETLSAEMRAEPADLAAFPTPFESELGNRLYRDLRYTKLPRVLRMNDRLSMAYSRELRVPFLDHRVVELAFRLGDDKKLRGGQGKFIVRQMLQRMIGGSLAARPKRAVVTPQREWIRGVLREPIQDLIASAGFRQCGFFDPEQVQRSFDDYCAGNGDNAFFIWQWINLDSWRRTFSVSL
jgi:asparagine synthase (glutamine-hydrolysing)